MNKNVIIGVSVAVVATVLFLVFQDSDEKIDPKEEVQLIKDVWKNYTIEALNNRGENAVKYLDSNTINYYSDILYHIKNSNRNDIEKLDILDRSLILMVRGLASDEKILSFNDGHDLIVFSLNQGLIDKRGGEQTVDNIIIYDQYASADLFEDGIKIFEKFEFRKENGEWKINIIAMINAPEFRMAFNQLIEELIDAAELNNENEAIEYILEFGIPNIDINKIWNKVNPY